MPEHTLKQFDTELEDIRARVLQMGGLVEQQITRAIEALTSGNVALARQVMEDDHHVNALEVTIDEECSTVIAKRQPRRDQEDLRAVPGGGLRRRHGAARSADDDDIDVLDQRDAPCRLDPRPAPRHGTPFVTV